MGSRTLCPSSLTHYVLRITHSSSPLVRPFEKPPVRLPRLPRPALALALGRRDHLSLAFYQNDACSPSIVAVCKQPIRRIPPAPREGRPPGSSRSARRGHIREPAPRAARSAGGRTR